MAEGAEILHTPRGSNVPAAPGASAPTPEQEERMRRRAGVISLVVGLALLVVKYFAYLFTDSQAILSDALESITNVLGATFALGGLLFAGRPADRGHPYGHGKIEYFSAVFEGGLISFAAALIVWSAGVELVRGAAVRQVELGLALTIGAGAANLALGWFLVQTGRRARSITLIADGEHVIADFKTSLGVVVGLALVRLTGLDWLDPVAAIVVGLNLAWTGFGLVRHAAGGLLDEEDSALLSRLVEAIERSALPGIIRVHRLRAIRSGRFTHADAHLIVPEFWTVEHAHEAVDAFERRVLDACTIEGEIIFHTDPCRRGLCGMCDVEGCPIRRKPFRARPPLTLDEATMSDDAFWGSRERTG